jgi:uncharacterized protein YbaA (DUF1428 family)
MTLPQLYERIKANSIKIEFFGHTIQSFITPTLRDFFVARYESSVKYYSHKEKIDPTVYELYEKMLNSELVTGENIHFSLFDTFEKHCFDCGESLYLIYINDDLLALMSRTEFQIKFKEHYEYNKNYKCQIKFEEIVTCECLPLRETGKLTVEFDVPTGELIFANYFNNKDIYDSEISNDRDGVLTIYDIMKNLAAKNVGYGQLTNTSVAVHKKDDGTEIIISGIEYDDGEKDCQIMYDGFTRMGLISCGVWRYQCADKTILENYDEKLPEMLEEKPSEHHEKFILTNVVPGTWVIDHFFDFTDFDSKDHIYSHLYLKK